MINKKEIVLLILIISGVFSSVLTISTVINDKNIINNFDNDIIDTTFFNLYLNKFNYMHGIYLIPNVIFFVFLLIYLEIPSYSDAYKRLKKDFKEKIKRDFKKF